MSNESADVQTNSQATDNGSVSGNNAPVGDGDSSDTGHDVQVQAASGEKVDASEYEALRKKFYEVSAENKKFRQKASASSKEALEAKKVADEAKKYTDQLKNIADQRIVRSELRALAVKEGLIDEDAFKMVDISSIKVSENGDVSGAAELITNLKASKPYLFKSNSSSPTNFEAPKQNPEIKLPNAMDVSDEEYINKNPKPWRRHFTPAARQ